MSWVNRVLGNKKQSEEEIIEEFEGSVQHLVDTYFTKNPLDGSTQPAPTNQTSDHGVGEENRCIIEFVVTKTDDILLNIRWAKDDSVTAKSIGQLLYQINNGDYKETSKNILLNVAVENPQKEDFIVECFEQWKTSKDQDPLLKPSQVFGMGRQPGGIFQNGYKPQ